MTTQTNRHIYIAYGSNLNLRQMKFRCPEAMYMGKGILTNQELIFKGTDGNCHLTIQRKNYAQTPVVLYSVTDRDLRALDRYEGFPKYYTKKNVRSIVLTDWRGSAPFKSGIIYIMTPNKQKGRPSRQYLDICKQGYADAGFDMRILQQAYYKSIGQVDKA